MGQSLAERLDGIPRKSLAMRGEADHKKLVASATARAFVALLFTAAFKRSGLTYKDAAYRMGYGDDQSPISRWTSGAEPPQMARFLSVPELRYGLLIALAELDEAAEIRTVVTCRRLA